MSDDGRVVVGESQLTAVPVFIWTELKGMPTAGAVLLDDYGIDTAGWKLDRVYGVSADGHIAGTDTNPSGNVEAWMAFMPVPGPGTIRLLLPGAVCACRRRR